MDPCPGPNVGEHHPIHPKECAAKIFWMPDLILRSERVGRVRRALYTQYEQTANVNSYNSQQQHTTSLGPGRFSLYGIHRRTPQCATRCERRRATARHGVQVRMNFNATARLLSAAIPPERQNNLLSIQPRVSFGRQLLDLALPEVWELSSGRPSKI